MNERRVNLLLGRGETLLSKVDWPSSGSTKHYPYGIDEQRSALHNGIVDVVQTARQIQKEYAPRGEVTAKLTLHPEFLAKSYFPEVLLNKSNLRLVGSRAVTVQPRALSRRREPKLLPSAVLLVMGRDSSFETLDNFLMTPKVSAIRQEELCRIESISVFGASDRLRLQPGRTDGWLEAVLHAEAQDQDIVDAFCALVTRLNGQIDRSRIRHVPGLAFAPLKMSPDQAQHLAEFSNLRVLRSMPVLSGDTADSAGTLRDISYPSPTLPTGPAIAGDVRAAIFDGGLPGDAFPLWAQALTPSGIPPANADDVAHGAHVTSAYLFGPVEKDQDELPAPYTSVDHVRVLPSQSRDERVVDVIDRVIGTLRSAKDQGRPYPLANLSMGPRMPIDDDDVHEWTVRLDQWLASGETLMTVAAGNDGALGADLGRVQPPADAVNALAIGSANSHTRSWNRAEYSAWGPGRSPGFIKPDGLVFGGCRSNPLTIFSPISKNLVAKCGTSYSSPIALRAAGGVLATVNDKMSPIALQALLISAAEFSARHHEREQVGWGRFPISPEAVLYSPEDEVRVIYQGVIRGDEPLRARVPVPSGLPGCNVHLTATFCYRAPTDPAHPVNYTRAGLLVRFRPDGVNTATFFGKGIYDTEAVLRRDALRWDTCMRRARKFDSADLTAPCFDINY